MAPNKQLDPKFMRCVALVLKYVSEKRMTPEKAIEKVRAEEPNGKDYTPEQLTEVMNRMGMGAAMISD